MAPSEQLPNVVMEEDDYSETEGSDSEDSNDSQDDPTYDIFEETQSGFSNLSMEKKSKSRLVCVYAVNQIFYVDLLSKPLSLCWNLFGFFRICSIQKEMDMGFVEDLDDVEIVAPVLDEKDEKSFEMVQKMIEGQREFLSRCYPLFGCWEIKDKKVKGRNVDLLLMLFRLPKRIKTRSSTCITRKKSVFVFVFSPPIKSQMIKISHSKLIFSSLPAFSKSQQSKIPFAEEISSEVVVRKVQLGGVFCFLKSKIINNLSFIFIFFSFSFSYHFSSTKKALLHISICKYDFYVIPLW